MIKLSTYGASVLFASMLVGACQPKLSKAASEELAPDSVRGTLAVTGTSFEKILVLRSAGETVRLTATPEDSAALSRIGGVEMVAHGSRADAGFNVVSFRVVAVDGKPVIDGVLAEDSGRLMLKAGSETVALGNPPAQLRSMIGARVWIGGPPATGPNTYGVIAPAPLPARQ